VYPKANPNDQFLSPRKPEEKGGRERGKRRQKEEKKRRITKKGSRASDLGGNIVCRHLKKDRE
jgi:hypothetical protein